MKEGIKKLRAIAKKHGDNVWLWPKSAYEQWAEIWRKK